MSQRKHELPVRDHLAGFLRNQRGSISVIAAATMVPLVIAAGTAVDMGRANRTLGHMQKSVDSAALAAAATSLQVETSDGKELDGEEAKIHVANQMIEANLLDAIKEMAEEPQVTVTGDQVLVELSAEMPTSFMGLVGIGTMSLAVAATAEATAKASGCIVALGPNGDGIKVGGNVDLEVDGCWLYSNKEGDKSIDVIGGAEVDVPGSCSVGSTSVSNNADVSGKRYTYCKPIADPMAEWTPPAAPSDCDYNKFTGGGGASITLYPGNYCGGIQLSGYDHIQFEPGIYHVTDGAVSVNSKLSITGSEVGFHIGEDVSAVTINGGTSVSLTAPTSGEMEGMLVAMDPLPAGTELQKKDLISATINGGSDLSISGTVYVPSAALNVSGNSTTLSIPTKIIAYSVELSGTSKLKIEVPAGANGPEFMTIVRLIK